MARTRTTTVVEPALLTWQEVAKRALIIAVGVGSSYLSGRAIEKGKRDSINREIGKLAKKMEISASEAATRAKLDRPRTEAFVRDTTDKIPGRDA